MLQPIVFMYFHFNFYQLYFAAPGHKTLYVDFLTAGWSRLFMVLGKAGIYYHTAGNISPI